jgi:RHS repeat-associated protein
MATPAGNFSYSYDAVQRMTFLGNPYSETSSWTYLDNGWLWTQTLGNGAKTTYTLNAWGMLTRVLNQTSGGTTLSDFSGLTYDGVANLKGLTASIPAVPAYGGTTSFTYDSKDQLTQEASTRAGGYTSNFVYDSAGNATTFKGVGRSFNTDNQDTAYTFDNNGNPTTYKGNTLTFDVENRMTAYASTLTAGYNGDDLRAWKQTASGRVYFLYDDEDPIIELDASGNVLAVNTSSDNGLVSRRSGGTSVFYQFDQQGNTVTRLDASQNTLSSFTFDGYGVGTATGPTDPFGYNSQSGYYTDLETGLHSPSYRYYDSGAGRFLNRDPIDYDGGVNVYGYLNNNPFGDDDVDGLQAGNRGRGSKQRIRHKEFEDWNDQKLHDEMEKCKDKELKRKMQEEEKGRKMRNKNKRGNKKPPKKQPEPPKQNPTPPKDDGPVKRFWRWYWEHDPAKWFQPGPGNPFPFIPIA